MHQKLFLFMKDYFFLPGFNDTLIVLDSIHFTGYGISEEKYDDYKKMNVAGKAILFYDGHPHRKKNNLSSWSLDPEKKMAVIDRLKPSVAFIICDSIDLIIDSLRNIKASPLLPPVVFINHEMAKTLLPEADQEMLDKAKSYINRKNKPRSFSSATSAFVHLVNNTEELMGENVAGFLEGSDKKDEVIIITSHYDHLGKKDSLFYSVS